MEIFESKIDEKGFLAYIGDEKVIGAVTLLYHQGHILHCKSYGRQDIERDIPMSIDSMFRIYSMTKPIVSTAVMMLYEDEELQLSDPVSKYIPFFSNFRVCKDGDAYHTEGSDWDLQEREITILQLLTHTSGLTYNFLNIEPVALLSEGPDSLWHAPLEEFVKAIGTMPLAFQPGEKWQYSFATDVLALVIEKVSGVPIDQFLLERILAPLGMHDTGYYVPEHKLGRFTALYGYDSGSGKRILIEDPTTCVAAGRHNELRGGHGLVSTAEDYLTFCRFLLGKGELDGCRLLQTETVQMMTENHLPASLLPIGADDTLDGYGFGLGFRVLMDPSRNKFNQGAGEFGWAGAANTYFWIDPVNDMIGISLLQYLPGGLFPFSDAFRTAAYALLADGS